VPYDDLWCVSGDAKAATACYLFENLVRNGYMSDRVTTDRVFRSPAELDAVAEKVKEE
jgi:hypothetical protein